MSVLGKILPDPRVRPDFTEGPAYLVTTADLVLTEQPCPCCRGRRPILETRPLPVELQGGARRRSPSYELLGDLRRYIRPEADQHGCSRCELLILIGQLMPTPHGAPPIESPEAHELRLMREAATPSQSEPSPVFDGELFSVGTVHITPGALTALLKGFRPELDPMYASVPEITRPFADEFLRRHATGDHGMVGTQNDADADRGRSLGPLASALDQNAAAIADGRGTVLSTYRVEQFDIREPSWGGPARTEKNGSVLLSIRTELAGSPIALVALADEMNQ